MESEKIAELTRLAHESKDKEVQVRAFVVRERLRGATYEDIAEDFHCARQTASKWVKAFLERGISALSNVSKGGRPPKVDSKSAEVFKEKVLANQEQSTPGTAKDFQRILEVEGIKLSESGVYRLLERLDLSKQVPRTHNPKYDSEVEKKMAR